MHLKDKKFKFIIYWTEWSIYGRKYNPKDTPIELIPEVAYAFFNVLEDGTIKSGDDWAFKDKRFTTPDIGVEPLDSYNGPEEPYYGIVGQFRKLKKRQSSTQFSLSIGGWTYSKYFSSAVSPANQDNFIKNIITTLKTYDVFNGVSFDWEYLSNNGINYGNTGNQVDKEDANNFRSFLAKLRQQLQLNSLENTQLSFCVTPDPNKIMYDPKLLEPYLDEFHIMTYDFHDGSWGETITAHQSNLNKVPYAKFSADEAVQAYLKAGVPRQKILIGAVTYSRGFSNSKGIGQAASGGSSDNQWEQGVADYKTLPRPGATEYYDAQAGAAYSYDPTQQVFNSYDNYQSTAAKAKYVKEQNLKGIIVWEMSGDYPIASNKSVVQSLYDNLIK